MCYKDVENYITNLCREDLTCSILGVCNFHLDKSLFPPKNCFSQCYDFCESVFNTKSISNKRIILNNYLENYISVCCNLQEFGIWNCEFCNVRVIVLDVCGGEKVFKELGRLLFVEDCCV